MNQQSERRRVVITGLGVITPLGTGVEKSWKALCAGESGIDTITRFDVSDFKTRIAGEVRDFDPLRFMDKKQVKRTEPFVQYALAASAMAIADAGLLIDQESALRTGVIIGSAIGGIKNIADSQMKYAADGPRKISPLFIVSVIANMAAGQVAINSGAKGFSTCVVTACAAGTHAIGDAFKVIQRGDADAMIAGGTEAAITPLVISGLEVMGATSKRNDQPQKACRPWDQKRDGMIPAEGAGILILEELERAKRRGARIYAEILGYGSNNDGYHVTAPDPAGTGASNCMKMALKDGGLEPQDIDYINAHGTSTPLNDMIETKAIKAVFGEHSKKVAISSNKSMIGHLWGAAGAVEAVFTVLSIYHGIAPPTINYEYPDPECDLDYVPNKSRKMTIRKALSNSFGFGGTNAVIALGRYEDGDEAAMHGR